MGDVIKVDMPVAWLMTLAVHGNMGEGEVPDFMREWARRELTKGGFAEDYRLAQKKRLAELERRIRNVLGDAPVDKLQAELQETGKVLRERLNCLEKKG